MQTWTREEIKADPVLYELLQRIVKQHKPPEHTVQNLLKLQHVPDTCEVTVRFLEWPGEKGSLYLSYEFSTWIKEEKDNVHFPTRVESITVYEDFLEYEPIRIKSLSAAKPDSRSNEALNLN